MYERAAYVNFSEHLREFRNSPTHKLVVYLRAMYNTAISSALDVAVYVHVVYRIMLFLLLTYGAVNLAVSLNLFS